MAVYGLACVFLYIVPAIVFLLPQALVAAELASGWSGGVFRWVSEGLSPRWGLLAVWCQFAMTIFYYPTLLGFVASTLAYVFNPNLAVNGVYTGIVIVVVFWLGVFISSRGGTGGIAKLASSGLLIGTLIPGALLVILGVVYLLPGQRLRGADGCEQPLPEVDRDRQPRADRQQLPLLLRDGDERRPRRRRCKNPARSSRGRCSSPWAWCC